MREALKGGGDCPANDEIPIGWCLVKDGRDIGADIMRAEWAAAGGHGCGNHEPRGNQRENTGACWIRRLSIEPCVMCKATGPARIPPGDLRATNQSSVEQVVSTTFWQMNASTHRVEVETGILKQNVQPSCRPSSAKVEKTLSPSMSAPHSKNPSDAHRGSQWPDPDWGGFLVKGDALKSSNIIFSSFRYVQPSKPICTWVHCLLVTA